MKALVLDDSRAMRLMLSRILQELEFEVAQGAGADEYVMKPFTRDVIADKLRLLGLTG